VRRLLLIIGTVLLAWAVRLLRMTWRVKVHGEQSDSGRVVAFWHGDQICIAGLRGWLRRAPHVLVSWSRDGELAAGVARRLGLRVVRGSSNRGALSGAVALGRRLREGDVVALAVDGPRGPRHQAGESAARLAAATGTMVTPVIALASRGLKLSSWDRMVVPGLFAAVHIFWGDPRLEGVDDGLECTRARAVAWFEARQRA